jgi:L-threonylcarbamoyladenylate synthase
MEGKIDGVVDGGPCAVGVESTILDLTCTPPRLLRPGGLPLEALEQLIGQIDVDKAVTQALKEGEQPKAPGMKYRHYAPKAPVLVVTGAPKASANEIARRVKPGDGVICFDEFAHLFPEQEVHQLGLSGDKLTQAQRVFDALRTFDNSSVSQIYAQCPDSRGLGLAVGNRLKKAAGFHVIEADTLRVVLGITGGTGAGKTSALNAIRELGGTIVDCDAVYHEMLMHHEEMRNGINAAFPGVFQADGQLNRKKLGQEVFAQKDRLAKLNGIVYQYLLPEIERRVVEAGAGLYAIDAINLLESGLDRLCDKTIAVTAPAELRVRRIMARDGITEQYARLRISAQKPDEYYRSKCDFELNNGTEMPETFQAEARVFFQKLIESIQEEQRQGAK